MRADDKDKLNECLNILDTTDLGLSLVWLWTWSTIKETLKSTDWEPQVTEDQMWDNLCEAVSAGQGFSLEWGAEQHHDEVVEWMLDRDYIMDPLEEKEDEDEDE